MPLVGPENGKCRRLAVLGSTGSIGRSTLEVVRHFPDQLQVVGLAAHRNWKLLAEQCREFRPSWAVLADAQAYAEADQHLFPRETRVRWGPEAVAELASRADVDIVVAAIVGAAGLHGTWAALEAGKTVALANKETLVVAGPLILELASQHHGQLLPVDSEHAALFQLLEGRPRTDLVRLVLTASGGPFRGKQAAELTQVTPQQALQHPTWQMGPKITIDSATLMNKALEVIEARWLFDVSADQIAVLIHPESMVHALVEWADGSVLAQLSPPDMRLPIQAALLYPSRPAGPARRVDWHKLGPLHFEPPDLETFPALSLGYEAARRGGTCGAVLNAANEAAVARFLAGEMAFLDIPRCCRAVLEAHPYESRPSLERLLTLDRWARQEVSRWLHPRLHLIP
ncbi:MAG: 1-deoxy-D-xylulose-5-phosphate reductoisomerase [Gemmataceae bacterium]|nr:1-deoxy-D-xylulose-5-phosphate reductoisomerase [Gemmataceae bacterium]MDW8241998.1 1-deoxy-D-xylulose-5-phosphate reductoisomerase [Thermogemmata sp.]